jgi:hypothetical protein
MFKEFVLRTPSDFVNEKTAMEKLVKMQHYGLPTRLLDLTTNALVALYFACDSSKSNDGKVEVLRIPNKRVKYYDSDTVSILANIAKRPSSFSVKRIKKLDIVRFNEQPDIRYLLHEIKEEKPYFQPIINPLDIESVVAVKVKQSNRRIIKQSGSFLIFGIHEDKKHHAILPKEWIMNLDLKGVDFNIDSESKDTLLSELNAVGINESTLFPELENQAVYLKNYYS